MNSIGCRGIELDALDALLETRTEAVVSAEVARFAFFAALSAKPIETARAWRSFDRHARLAAAGDRVLPRYDGALSFFSVASGGDASLYLPPCISRVGSGCQR